MFLLGHWRDYDELESSLSMPELMHTVEAMHRVEKRKQKFMAALQGIDIDKDESTPEQPKRTGPVTLEEVQARAVARLTGDVVGAQAIAQGITPEMGLQYEIMGGTDIG